ncbi:MAG: TerB family tellurite resistance protein [Maribacter sp.]|nr:TerB family tellurite resistance protein [Maribacter sp.]MBT8301850.1 TerB family tellurite resistance protein [Maribacter sp.]NNK18249.1 TerB family tellurite resistance protein [Maribacter sp.]
MTILEAYESGKHERSVSHFAAIVKLARVDGSISPEEEVVLKRLAFKLDVSDAEVKMVFKNPKKYPLIPPYSLEERIETLNDLCSIIYADHVIDEEERKLIFKYAIGLGFTSEQANVEIQKCIPI